MAEVIELMTRDEVENFIEGNDSHAYGECWIKISETLIESYKGIQTEEVISQRMSDGAYFEGTYEAHHSDGWFPRRWDTDTDPYMILTQVYPHVKETIDFTTQDTNVATPEQVARIMNKEG